MTDASKTLVIGHGAQAKYVVETFSLLSRHVWVVMGWTSETPDWPRTYGCEAVPFDADILIRAADAAVTHFIACTPRVSVKKEWTAKAAAAGLSPVSAIHPAAAVSKSARLGAGVIINAGAVIQPFASIGAGAMIHAGCVVEHDAAVGDYANLAPGVRMAGWSSVGEEATVFTGANLIPTVKVGARSIVAAGATVIADVPEGVLVAGVPAVIKKTL